jgi:LPS O-antigen subunit length determinant protein (WzzB/FepE family)
MDKGIEQTRRLPDLQKKYQELLVMYTEQHPEVLRLKAEIDSTMRLLEGKQGGGSDGDSTESDRRTRAASAIKQRNVAELERDREAYKKIYDSLVASIGRSEVSAQVQVQAKGDTFRILDPAVLPIEPAGPARWKIILLAIFAGIAGGVGTAIVLDMMDNTIKSIDMLKDIGLPIIATIPRIQNVEVIVAARKKDRMVYGAAGAYLAFFIVLAIVEFLK